MTEMNNEASKRPMAIPKFKDSIRKLGLRKANERTRRPLNSQTKDPARLERIGRDL
jgi:hypothetical protein